MATPTLQPDRDQRQESPQGGFPRGVVIVVGVLLVGGVIAWMVFGKHQPSAPKREEMHMITLPPPVPPPPPPPPPKEMPPAPPEQVAQPKADTLEAPKDDAMKATDGPSDSFGLTGSLNGTGQGGGGRFGWYASSVQAAISDALHKNEKTKSAALHLEVRVWPDATGKVLRVEVQDATGDKALDEAIKNEVLMGLQLQPPPKEMPRPIVLSISRR
jgi:periplasmic protein TonB